MTAKAVRIKIKLGGHPSAAPGVGYTPPLIPWRRAAVTRQRMIIAVGISLVIATVAVWLFIPKSDDQSVPSWVSDARAPSSRPDEIGAKDPSAFSSTVNGQTTNLEPPLGPIASTPQTIEAAPATIANNVKERDHTLRDSAVEPKSKPVESGNQNNSTPTLVDQKPASGVTSTTKPINSEGVAEKITSVNVVRAQLATKLNGLEPANSVGNQIKAKTRGTVRVYYFNELHGLKGKTISHQWTHDGKIYANVSAEIKNNTWRMYSSKALNSTMLGEWKIQVTDEKGDVLATRTFSYN